MTRLRQAARRAAVYALATGVLAACTATGDAQQVTKIRFQLDWRFEGPSALFLLPAAKGYFKQEGLDVTIDAGNGSAGAVNRVASGTYDMGFADISALIEFLASNRDNPAARMQAVYMLYDETPAAVFVLKSSGITKPSDLMGKTMGAPIFDAGRKTFPLFVRANKLDPDRIKWQSMDAPLRETMLARGEVDGITGFYFTSLLNLNARGVKDDDVVVFKYADHGVRLYGNAVLANQKFIDRHPTAISAFLRALTRGVREVLADPDGAIRYVNERDPLIDAALERRRLRLAIDTVIATPAVKANGIGAADRQKLQATVAQVVEAFNLQTVPSADALFNSSFLPAASERQIQVQ